MKTIRSMMTLAGLSLVLFVLGAVGARGQVIYSAQFVGTFTLPFEAQWGALTLPPGGYTLEYGMQEHGHRLVVVRGKAKGSPYGMILAGPQSHTSTAKSAIVCVREGNVLIVRALDMPSIGESVSFKLPHGKKLVANELNKNGYTQLAEAPMLVERIPVTVNAK